MASTPFNQSNNIEIASQGLLGTSYRSQLNSFLSSSPIAAASILQDLEDDDHDGESAEESDSSTVRPLEHSMIGSWRRPSFIAQGPRSTVVPSSLPEHGYLSKRERQQARNEERSLLRDCNLIPPKHPRLDNDGTVSHLAKKLSISGLRKVRSHQDEYTGPFDYHHDDDDLSPSEETCLIGDPSRPYGGVDTPENINKTWEDAIMAGRIHTSWQREAKTLTRYSRSLILTFLLQYSLTVASIFTVGHIGKVELGAVSLASMTANITGYAVYQGLATALDTLAAQAYGSGRKKLVGLQLQRMVLFLWVITVPISIIWLFGTRILQAIVPEKETAALAGLYLKVLVLGAPGYAAFEGGKRFVQAQGLFSATTYCLLICAPLNALMNYIFVWKFEWGFIGAPIAVVITETLLPITLFLYVVLFEGRECWGGFEKRALKNWGPMVRLALPGLVMVLAEFLAFEILTLSASWLSTTHLAAQSVLSTLSAITYQIPFPISIAASTRIANLIGATLADAAKTAAKVSMIAACIVGCFNVVLLSSLRDYIPRLFTNDDDVIALVAGVLPLCASFQLFDAVAANCNGILRGLGRQEIGGYVNLVAYYLIAMPISIGTGFGMHWDLYGLWAGPATALAIVSIVEAWFLYNTSWEKAVEAAQRRNITG